ncbi:MAG: hypothetical protein JOZ16_06510 [Methylobacteriaceae bacterium]|nr:hypothetical protein [Methylobacteriaceae bacterium]MBV9841402.1 hypothetical protein [Sphingomonadaceae bacterium]
MADKSSPRGGPKRAKRDADTRALINRLESRAALIASEKATALGVLAAPGLVEPHRSHHAYALGGDQVDCELATSDARAMRGLMSLGATALAALLDSVAAAQPSMHVTRLWSILLATDRDRFEARGTAVDRNRLVGGGGTAGDEKTVFEASLASSGIVDAHRDQHAFALGSDLFYCGLVANDAIPMLGLMSTGPACVAAELRRLGRGQATTYVGRLWREILARRRDDYEARGRLVSWQRRWARYNVAFEAWRQSGRADTVEWRPKPMTVGQRHMVRDTAIVLGIEIPAAMSRGAAHDWLMANGANALFRKAC